MPSGKTKIKTIETIINIIAKVKSALGCDKAMHAVWGYALSAILLTTSTLLYGNKGWWVLLPIIIAFVAVELFDLYRDEGCLNLKKISIGDLIADAVGLGLASVTVFL